MADQTLTPLPTARTSTPGRPMEKFDASFARYDGAIRDNHGKIWSQESLATLAALFHDGESLAGMCETLQRPADGTLKKLVQHRLLHHDPFTNTYTRCHTQPKTKPTQPEEPTMTHATIETKTFIEGIDAANMGDEQIFKKIASLENSIKVWGAIENKPKKLDAMIEQTKADIKALVVYVDGR